MHFIVKAKAIRPKAPNENEPLSVRVKNKLIELGGTADARTLQRALTLKKETFTDALKELLATNQVVLTQRENAKGRLVDVVTIPKNSKQGSDTSDTLTVCENDTTETSPKPQNESKCQKSKCQNGSDTLTQKDVAKPNPTVPEPTVSPEPTVPEPTVPAPEPATDQMPAPEAVPEPDPEPTVPEPLPVPEPEPASPESIAEPKPELSDSDLLECVMNHLRQIYSCQKIPAAAIRQTLDTICGERANVIGKMLFPEHLWKLGQTNYFIFADNEFRPKGYRKLIAPNNDGIIDSDPLPPNFE